MNGKILGAFATVAAALIAYGIYAHVSKNSPRASRLLCQKEVITFERSYVPISNIKTAQQLLKQGAYTVASTIAPSKYMKSTLFRFVSKEKTDTTVAQTLQQYMQTNAADKVPGQLLVSYLIYENDKLDPGKKTAQSKLYAGYLVFEFKLEETLLYKVQIDFMDPQGKDIPLRVQCAIASFSSLQ